MKKYRFLAFLLLIPMLNSLLIVPAGALEPIDLYCTHAVLLDANYGEVLYNKNAYERAFPASTTKIMTALLVLEGIEAGQLSLSTPVAAGETRMQGVTESYVNAALKLGEVLTVEELLYCTLVPSYADAANVLAAELDGTIEDFVTHMNRKAGALGCQDTHFTNPVGIHNEEHYSTAYDLALIMQECLRYDTFRTMIKTAEHRVPATNMSGERHFYNTNGLISNLNYLGYVYDKCIGGKTGRTDEAGRCLVAAAEDGETLLISVILGSGPMQVPGEEKLKQGQFRESKRLLQWGFENFRRVTITQGDEPVDKVAVTMSRQADEVNVKPQGSVTRTLPKDLDLENIETEVTLFAKEVEAPVEEGQVLGTMKLSYEGEVYGVLDLVAVNAVERSELLYKKEQFFEFFRSHYKQLVLAAVSIVAAGVLLRVLVFRKKPKRHAGSGAGGRGSYRGTRVGKRGG